MLLSDDEIDAIADKCFVQYMNDENDAYDLAFARAIEAAILAKLGAMELPEPESFEAWNAKQHGDPEEIGLLQALRIAYCSGQDSVNVRQAYAQGAAAQLAEKPSAWKYDENGDWWVTGNRQEVDGDATGEIIELYTRREA